MCCWLGCDTARYGDDCASYCLASAGVFTSTEGKFVKPAILSVMFYGLKQVMHALKDVVRVIYYNQCNSVLFRQNMTAAVFHFCATVSYFCLIK